jgi:AcrR family transcriptional regulator
LYQEASLKTPCGTKQRILDSAEKLFAEQGFAGTSMRAITTAADANLAAVNYHFGSKESLIDAVFARRLEPINRERLAWLDRLEAGGDPSVEEILEAFLAPPLRVSQDPVEGESLLHVAQMIGHATSRPDSKIKEMLIQQFDTVVERFTAALARQLPQLEPPQLLWRFLFMIGSMAHTMAISQDVKVFTKGLCDPNDVEGLIQAMVPFAAAGFRAPVGVTKGESS